MPPHESPGAPAPASVVKRLPVSRDGGTGLAGTVVRTTLRPGHKGTRALVKSYGDLLVCVRYRYDKARFKRYKTVELIIDEQDWVPDVIVPPDRRVFVHVGYAETELRERVKTAGGLWVPAKGAWLLPYRKAHELGLDDRVEDEG